MKTKPSNLLDKIFMFFEENKYIYRLSVKFLNKTLNFQCKNGVICLYDNKQWKYISKANFYPSMTEQDAFAEAVAEYLDYLSELSEAKA